MILIQTSKGDIKLKLDESNTPKTAANFLAYVKDGYYDNTIFHRVIDGFMVQGGGLEEDMSSKDTKESIENEAKNAMPNRRGTIAMARTNQPHSATSQFFINLVNNDFLNYSGDNAQGYGYCAFGEVVEGMDIIDAIAKVKTGNKMGHADVPVEPVFIVSIREEA